MIRAKLKFNGLPKFECDANSYMDAYSCCIFLEETTIARHHNCCKKKRLRKEAYWKIKEKVKNVNVIFLNSSRQIARLFKVYYSMCF